jgi:hypothetical protein
VAVGVLALLATAALVFVESTGRTLNAVTLQSDLNQAAGHTAEFILQRIRLANSATNDILGNTLTLSFDDNPTVDSNADGMTWNDQNHFERFSFSDGDGLLSTLTNNVISYKTNINTSYTTNLITSSVRKLGISKVFAVTNGSTVQVTFGLLTTNSYRMSQMIEIRTTARLRNKLQ